MLATHCGGTCRTPQSQRRPSGRTAGRGKEEENEKWRKRGEKNRCQLAATTSDEGRTQTACTYREDVVAAPVELPVAHGDSRDGGDGAGSEEGEDGADHGEGRIERSDERVVGGDGLLV